MSRYTTTFATVLGIFALFALAACDTMSLEEEDIGGATEPLYGTSQGFEAGVAAAYRRTRDFWGNTQGVALTTMGTDTWGNGQDGGWQYYNEYSPALNPSSGEVSGIWNSFYQGIWTVNTVLDHVDDVEGMDAQVLANREGELKFLRGLYYFTLLRTYGEVPLNTEPARTAEEALMQQRAPLDSIYTQIVQDLQDAKDLLAPASEQSDWGRATQGAAQHLLAEVYLERAYDLGNDQDYVNAYTEAEEVIDSGEYRLLDNYGDWLDPGNEENEEIVWAVQYSDQERFNGIGNQAHLLFKPHYEQLSDALDRSLEYGRPWLRVKPTGFLINLYDHENSNRYEQSFRTVWLANTEAGDVAVGDTAVWMPHPQENVDPDLYQGEADTILTPENYSPLNIRHYPEVLKHDDPNRSGVNEPNGTRDLRVFRLAHTYLVAAEARHQAGDDGIAADHLNVVRERVARPGREAQMRVDASDVDLDFILDEWGRETAGEFRRWFDLARTGTLVERVRAHNTDGATAGAPNIQEYHTLRPIPQSQIDAMGGDFEQNPGY